MAQGTNTRVTLLRDVALALRGLLGLDPLRTSTTLGSTSTVTDTGLVDADASVNKMERPYVRIDETVASGPASGETSRVRKSGLTIASGVLTISPVVSAAVQAGTDFSLWPASVDPKVAERELNFVLRNLKQRRYVPVSLLTNPDFEAVTSGAGVDSWTYANATVSTTNGYSSTAQRVRHGTYAARLQGSGGAPRIQSSTQKVNEGKQYLIAAAGMADVGNVECAPYNVTTSADIGTAATHDEESYLLMMPPLVTAPSGCEEMAVRLRGTAASDDLYFDDAWFWPVQQSALDLPSWVEDPGDVIGVGYFERGPAAVGTYTYALDEGKFRPWGYQSQPEVVEEGGAHPFRLILDTPVTEPLFLFAWRPFAELSLDTDTTTADRRLIVYLVLNRIYMGLAAEAVAKGAPDVARGWTALQAQTAENAERLLGPNLRFGKQPRPVEGTRLAKYGNAKTGGYEPPWNR